MENDLSRIVDALPGLVWTALPDGHVDFVNRRWCEYTGLSVEEIHGEGWQRAIHPDDLPKMLAHWRSILASGEACEMAARLRRFDGEYRLFAVHVSPLADAAGNVVKWCGINTDIADRTRSQEALHSRWWLWPPGRDEHFREIIDSNQAIAAHVTPAGVVEHVNRPALEYFGTTLEEIRGWQVSDIFHPDDLQVVIDAWKGGLETGTTYDVNARLRRVDGAYRWFHARGFLLRDMRGQIVLCYLLLRDIDDWKRAEALLAGEKRLLELVASGHSMPGILDALCELVEGTASGCYCSVVLVDPSGARLEHGAAPSLPASFITSILGRPVNVDSGPCAMAAYLNQQVIADDLTSETRWAVYRWCAMALEHGLKACWSTPISSTAGKVLGAFAIYYDAPKTPTALDQSLIEQITNIASIAIERAQSDAALKRSEAFLAKAQHLSSTGSFSWCLPTDTITGRSSSIASSSLPPVWR
ncbi:MAG: PAS domain-containing protein [Betaproteobacteria bacterium]